MGQIHMHKYIDKITMDNKSVHIYMYMYVSNVETFLSMIRKYFTLYTGSFRFNW